MSVIKIPRLPDQFSVRFGPAEAIAHTVLDADLAARSVGVRLSVSSDFEELAHVNQINRADWYPLMPNFDIAGSTLDPERSFWVKGIDDHGDVVLTYCVRLYILNNTTLKDEVESLRFYYDAPQAAFAAGVSTEATAPIAQDISGRISYSGTLWVRSDFRGSGLGRLIPPLSRALALTRWYPSHHVCFVSRGLIERGMHRAYGYRNLQYSVWLREFAGFGAGVECGMCWMDTAEATAEIEMNALGRHGVRVGLEREAGHDPRAAA